MQDKQKAAVYIGKFQIIHNAHYDNMKHCLNNYDKTMVIVGSTNKPKSTKYPFLFKDIKKWINQINEDIIVKPSKDYPNDDDWFNEINQIIKSAFDTNIYEIHIIGHDKDETSYYLNHFKDFKVDFQPSKHNGISATDVREKYFSQNLNFKNVVPGFVYEDLVKKFKTDWYYSILGKS